jgi:hypothetical protein
MEEERGQQGERRRWTNDPVRELRFSEQDTGNEREPAHDGERIAQDFALDEDEDKHIDDDQRIIDERSPDKAKRLIVEDRYHHRIISAAAEASVRPL